MHELLSSCNYSRNSSSSTGRYDCYAQDGTPSGNGAGVRILANLLNVNKIKIAEAYYKYNALQFCNHTNGGRRP